ncbi:MAG: Phosphoribosylformylglycinamidine synthase, synthetase subunit, partial [Acidobacteriaceae bacterium]|nr:Phosphoribosylformylglycinamidine synthase, synthetase subunit [Acidobacteriaceae bacterium]
DNVPQRETGMTSYEIMLSESQERMLLVAEKGREHEVLRVFEKWGLDGVIVGEVIAEPQMRIRHHGELVADIPNYSLTDDAPLYHRPVGTWKPPVPLDPPAEVLEALKQPRDYTRTYTEDLKKLLASANICSKRWVFEQYDSMVQTNTVQGPGGEGGVMRVKGSGTPGHERGLAMALDGNGRWCYLDPKQGAKLAVAEAARKVACTGAVPVAATNCLNFGNPEKPEIMAQLSAAIDGIAEACTALGTPITGGNVSLYNETKGEGIYPTPVIGIVGILDDASKAVASDFARPGDVLLLIDASAQLDVWKYFGSSEYARIVLGSTWGTPYVLDLNAEGELHRRLAALSNAGLIHAARDISDGGLAVALAEACFAHGTGVDVQFRGYAGLPSYTRLFGEDPTRVLIACAPEEASRIQQIFSGGNPGIWPIGTVTDGTFRILIDESEEIAPGQYTNAETRTVIDTNIAELRESWSGTLQESLAGDVVTA